MNILAIFFLVVAVVCGIYWIYLIIEDYDETAQKLISAGFTIIAFILSMIFSFFGTSSNSNKDDDKQQSLAYTTTSKVTTKLSNEFFEESSEFNEEDNDIENNSFSNAVNISPNSDIQDRLSSNEDKNYYKFNLENSGKINLTFLHEKFDDDGLFWEIHLYDNNNENIDDFYFEISADVVESTSDNYRLPEGEYYILIEPYYFSSYQYEFCVNFQEENDFFEIEPNNDFDIATQINVNEYYTGNIQSIYDIDYYLFSLENKGSINLSFEHKKFDNGSTYWEVSLVDYNDSEEKEIISSAGDTSTTDSYTLRLPTGKYYLKIKSYSYSNMDYSFCINYIQEDDSFESESNNEYSEANDILLDNEYIGNLQSSDDIDIYKFTISKNCSINLNFSHNLFDEYCAWGISILDENNELTYDYSLGDESEKNIIVVNLSAGTYYVKINAYSGYNRSNNCDYKIKIS